MKICAEVKVNFAMIFSALRSLNYYMYVNLITSNYPAQVRKAPSYHKKLELT